jgi:hypothetical protein
LLLYRFNSGGRMSVRCWEEKSKLRERRTFQLDALDACVALADSNIQRRYDKIERMQAVL